jgi:tetratricopeptide (TPR) repeat protein
MHNIHGEEMVKAALASVVIMICLTGMSCKETPETWNKKAEKALKASKYEEAIRCYKKIITLDPNDMSAHYHLGRLYQREGKLDSAISAYKKAVAIAPEERGLYNLLGELYLAQGMINEALPEFKKALDIDADFAVAHYNIGIAYKQLSKNTAAAKHLYEAGLLAFINGDNTTALNAYRALEETGPERIVQELHEMLEPLLEDETRK